MNRILSAAFCTALILTTTACDPLGIVSGGDGNFKRVSALWPDVPAMDGLGQPIEAELPSSLKLFMRTGLNLMMRGLGEGSPEWDWLSFTTTKTPADVQNFYTTARMSPAPYGWASDQSGCASGASGSLFCAFTKEQASKQIGLLIMAAQDEKTKQTSVFFLRGESAATPAPSKQTTSTNAQRGSPMTQTAVPYQLDQRLMPSGLDLDQLLPKQVGPYTRASVEGAPIKVDGNSVYAHYRSGATEIFVEFAVASSAANAQSILETAAGETFGAFPTDPRVGVIGREPSYLKVTDADGAFFAWTRGGYYFSAHAKSGQTALDAFMQAFPY